MKPNPTAIPQGTRTYQFEEAAHKRFLEQTLHAVFRSRGFQEIVTPPFEYYESAIIGLSQDERNRIIRFTETDSGRIIVLRADITSQVARSAATHLAQRPLPLRLCYTGSVFRRARTGKGEQYMVNQSGIEIVGHAGVEADIEVLLSLVSALGAVGLSEYSISLGHAGFLGSFFERFDDTDRQTIKKALGKKEKPAIKAILDKAEIPPDEADGFMTLTELYGGEEVFAKAEAICRNEESRRALENLKTIYSSLCEAGLEEKVSIDLAETRGFGYYTGVNMELFSASGSTLGTGGRYDNLVKRFKPDLPAVGFAFDIDNMIEAVRQTDSPPVWRGSDILLVGAQDDAPQTAEKLREAGLMVNVPFAPMTAEEAKSYAEKMNIPNILIEEPDGQGYDWIKTETGEIVACGLGDFINAWFSGGKE